MDISNVIAAAVQNANNPPTYAAEKLPGCLECGKSLTAEEFIAHVETGETAEFMCDACADLATAPAPDPAAVALAAEIARLKAENAKLVAKKTGKPATPQTAQTAANTAVTPPPANTAGFSPADAKILEVIAKFKSPARSDGKVPGTFAVKVHGYLHACGVPEERVRVLIEDATKRNVISRMSIPVKGGAKRMMLYFDARERTSYDRQTLAVPASEKASVAAAFGL